MFVWAYFFRFRFSFRYRGFGWLCVCGQWFMAGQCNVIFFFVIYLLWFDIVDLQVFKVCFLELLLVFFFLGKSIQSFVINCFMGLVGFKGLIIRVSLLGFIIWQVLCMFLVGFGQYLIFFVEIQWLKLLEGRGRFLVFF